MNCCFCTFSRSLVRNPYYEWSPSSDGSAMTPDHWEVPLSELRFGNVLGSGAFGEVLEATLSAGDLVSNWLEINKLPGMQCPDEGLTVAVKKLLCKTQTYIDLLDNISIQ